MNNTRKIKIYDEVIVKIWKSILSHSTGYIGVALITAAVSIVLYNALLPSRVSALEESQIEIEKYIELQNEINQTQEQLNYKQSFINEDIAKDIEEINKTLTSINNFLLNQ